MKPTLLILALSPLALFTSCSTSPADAAVNAATSNMGPAQSAAVRQTTGHGTGPVEKTKNKADKKIDRISN